MHQKRSSTDSTIDTTGKKFKDNILEAMGGGSQFHFLTISFCEKITKDKSLKLFFGGLEMANLVALQKDMLTWAFLDVSAEESEALRGRLVLRNHLMVQQGFRGDHFDMLEKHFTDAMLEVWLDKDVMDNCSRYFKNLRSIFDDCKDFQEQAALEEDEMIGSITNSFGSSMMLSSQMTSQEFVEAQVWGTQ